MKIVVWNCNMAFRKKVGLILEHDPDVIVVPECEHPDKLKFKPGIPAPTDMLWEGANRNKGLGIISYNKYKLKLLDAYNSDLKTILPIEVTDGAFDFTLLAIWAYNPQDREYNYIGQVWKAVQYYERILKGKAIILAGDFNSNVFWDKQNRKSNHSMVVKLLADLNIHSTYHIHKNISQGKEEHPTFFLYRNQKKPYHIDYCFASSDLLDKLETLEVGTYEKWSSYSDHSPLIVSFKT